MRPFLAGTILAIFVSSLMPACALEATPAAPSVPAVKAAAEKKTSLLERVLELNRVQEPELDVDSARAAFKELSGKARMALQGLATPKEKVAALNKVLLADREVSYLSNLYWRDATLAASLLRGKGNCLSTSTLYVLIGEALDLPVRMVLVPGHAFARWDGADARINIETTSGGLETPDAEYLSRRFQSEPADIAALGWGLSLDQEQTYGELLRTAACHRVGENRLEEALEMMQRAETLMPGRSDIALARYELMANITNRRTEARAQIALMLQNPKLPPSVRPGALSYLAADAASRGDHEAEKKMLLAAFSTASKANQIGVLTNLAFCHRALKDFRGAVRYMELVVALDPRNADTLYSFAIMLKNDKRLPDALAAIHTAREINPESWNLQAIEAGYMVLNGQREEGLALFKTIKKPRGDVEFFAIMQTWFQAVSQQRDKFYEHFEAALAGARSTRILEWIDQDVDLDVYRNEPQFKTLVAKHRERLLGK